MAEELYCSWHDEEVNGLAGPNRFSTALQSVPHPVSWSTHVRSLIEQRTVPHHTQCVSQLDVGFLRIGNIVLNANRNYRTGLFKHCRRLVQCCLRGGSGTSMAGRAVKTRRSRPSRAAPIGDRTSSSYRPHPRTSRASSAISARSGCARFSHGLPGRTLRPERGRLERWIGCFLHRSEAMPQR